MMPSVSGVEVCRRIRERVDSAECYIFIILLTGKRNPEEIIEGLEAGADDYVTKPYNAEELQLRIRAGKRVIDLQDELVQAQRLLKVQVDHDALTGVLNRGAIINRAKNELARAAREGSQLGIAMLDVDHFKRINDNYGHQVGDHVLRETVVRIQGAIRPYDILGRYGGEEFLLILPGLREQDLQPLERVRESIGQSPFSAGALSVPVTVSAGVGWARESDHLDELIGVADRALYDAKAQGRDRVICGKRA